MLTGGGAAGRRHPGRLLLVPSSYRQAHDAAMGLLYLHRRGLIHRDVKSPNMLVSEHWRVQVGAARGG